MQQRKRKWIAPILVSVLVVLYYVAYFGLLMAVLEGVWKYLLGILPLALSAAIVMVCIERIKEIEQGEEDDLSKY